MAEQNQIQQLQEQIKRLTHYAKQHEKEKKQFQIEKLQLQRTIQGVNFEDYLQHAVNFFDEKSEVYTLKKAKIATGVLKRSRGLKNRQELKKRIEKMNDKKLLKIKEIFQIRTEIQELSMDIKLRQAVLVNVEADEEDDKTNVKDAFKDAVKERKLEEEAQSKAVKKKRSKKRRRIELFSGLDELADLNEIYSEDGDQNASLMRVDA